MIAQLTRGERQLAILISLVVAVVGLLLGIAGRNDPIGLHGALIFVTSLLTIALSDLDRNILTLYLLDKRSKTL
jgi:cytochrome c oxidase cbb3-type subunit I